VRFVLVLCALMTACAASDPAGAPATEADVPAASEFRVVSSGAYGRLASSGEEGRRAPWVEVAAEADAFRTLWQTYVSAETPSPSIDFTTESAVFLLMPPRSTGGYSIEWKGGRLEGDAVIAEADLIEPGPGAIVTQAFTAPYLVVAVPKKGISRADWVNQGRLLARHNAQ
jgi:hypothetical protein